MLGENDILSLLEDLGAQPLLQGKNIVCKTICHGGHKHKLIYFSDSKTFRCFTDKCGNMSIFDLVSNAMNLDFRSSFKYVCMKFGISYQGDYSESDRIEMSFFQKFKSTYEKPEIKILDEKILNTYDHLYHESWIKDGISAESMKKFGIMYSILDHQIIIPHRNEKGELIGVRGRNLNKQLVDEGKKYMPVYWKKEILKHPTGAALYGLNLTKDDIKKYKTVILFESEKSVLQLDTMFPKMSIGVCLSGSSITSYQLDLLKELDIEEVVIALDKEYEEIGTEEEKFYAEKITSVFVNKLSPYYRTSVIWDVEGLLNYKSSPTDHGKEVFKRLFETRIQV